jgi:hypothetical protein
MAVLLHVAPIIPEPIKVAVNRFAFLDVARNPSSVAVHVIAVLLDCVYVAIKSVLVIRIGSCRERDCRSKGQCSESYDAVDV